MKEIASLLISTWYIWAIVIVASILRWFSPRIKGYFGEKSVSIFLSRLDPEKYKVIHNVMVKVDGKTTQIDHIVVSSFGVFVIETKNYKGWIMGDESAEYWTQIIYKHKEKLYNPIRQNYGHIQALKEYLKDFPSVPYISIVTFTTKADLKVKTSSEVIYTVNILKTIRKYTIESVPDDIREKIFSMLSSINIVDKEERKKHVQDIHNMLDTKESMIKNGICPSCGGKLVLRKGKYGSFTGCSGYPKCRFKCN